MAREENFFDNGGKKKMWKKEFGGRNSRAFIQRQVVRSATLKGGNLESCYDDEDGDIFWHAREFCSITAERRRCGKRNLERERIRCGRKMVESKFPRLHPKTGCATLKAGNL